MELGTPELLILFVIVVLIFGPGRIASLGRELGQGIRSFREGIFETKDPPEEGKEPEIEP